MKRILFFLLLSPFILGFTSCKDKKESKDIITKMPDKPKKQSGPMTMSTGDIPPRTISWMGGNYTIKISRNADKSLPLIEDASGNKYYDNRVRLSITRGDGSSFFDRTYTAEDFKQYTNSSVTKNWGLTGFNFDTLADGKLLFAIAIGSPDEMADNEFVPLTLSIDSQGNASVSSQVHQDDESADDE